MEYLFYLLVQLKHCFSILSFQGTPSLYLALLHGDLMLWSGDTKSTPVFSSSNNTFSDSSWHVLRLTLSGNGYVETLHCKTV